MNKHVFLSAAILVGLIQPAHADPLSRRATITGGGGNGRCAIEVTVDGTAEVEISGDLGLLTTISGQPATWRRFQCNAPVPRNPVDFRFARIGGRGSMGLLQDPRSTGGRTVIHIDDPQGGRGGYSFDLQWRGFGAGGWSPAPSSPLGPGRFPMARAIRICQDSVADRLNRDGYQNINCERIIPDDNPGRHDWVVGTATGARGYGTTRFSFSCSVDFNSGRVRSVDVRRR
jgi:hypothetical protein